jgi:hypothetical protein
LNHLDYDQQFNKYYCSTNCPWSWGNPLFWFLVGWLHFEIRFFLSPILLVIRRFPPFLANFIRPFDLLLTILIPLDMISLCVSCLFEELFKHYFGPLALISFIIVEGSLKLVNNRSIFAVIFTSIFHCILFVIPFPIAVIIHIFWNALMISL